MTTERACNLYWVKSNLSQTQLSISVKLDVHSPRENKDVLPMFIYTDYIYPDDLKPDTYYGGNSRRGPDCGDMNPSGTDGRNCDAYY